MKRKPKKGKGTCGICWLQFKTHSSDGNIHRHGSRPTPCPGSSQPPVEIVSIDASLSPPSSSSERTIDSENQTSVLTQPDSEVGLQHHLVPPVTNLSHPVVRGALVKRIPRSARASCAALLGELVEAVVRDPADTERWLNLLGFGGRILAKPKRGGVKRKLTSIILSRITNWRSKGPACDTDDDETKPMPVRRKGPMRHDSAKYLASAIASKLEDGNYKAAIRLICCDDEPAPDTPETLAGLKAKHPPAPSDRKPIYDPKLSDRFAPLQISERSIVNAISSFPPGSAAGPDGVTPQHLKDLISVGADCSLIRQLSELVNLMLEGSLPVEVNEVIYGANLIALKKRNGGIRPIAVGYTLRSLAAKCANNHAVAKLSTLLAPIQLGVGVPGGAEAAVHATRRWVTSMPTDCVLVKLDFTNAFNTLRRDSLLEAVARDIPELYSFAHASYSCRPMLRHGSSIIRSEEGTQQGDPMGPLEFCIALQPILSELKSELRVAFLDDLTLGGKVDVVAHDVQHIAHEAAKLGLELNRAKCEIIFENCENRADNASFHGFKDTPLEEATLLGSPLIPGHAIDMVLNKKVEDLERAVGRLSMLHSHDALILLRNGLSVPKLLYTMRTALCVDCPSLARFDSLLRSGLSSILNVELSDEKWLQASLPVKDGGLGIRSAATLALSAFLASAASTSELQANLLPPESEDIADDLVNTALEAWKTLTGAEPPTGSAAHRQREWDIHWIKNVWTALQDSATTDLDRARLLASRSPHSGDWLLAPPVTALGLRLSDEEIRVAVGVRLGTTLCEPHLCHCGERVGARGLNGLACKKKQEDNNDITF